MKQFIALILSISFSVLIAGAQPLQGTISSQTNVIINGQSTGAVTLSGSGGTSPYQYSKNGGAFQSSATFTGLPAGNYTFTIRDAASATATISATISQTSALKLSIGSLNNVAVAGQNSGSVTLSASGGTIPYEYSQDGFNYQSSSSFGSLPAGNYTFTVKDASRSTSTINATITESNFLGMYLVSQIDILVIGTSTGSVTLAGGGGTAPYRFSKDGINFQSSPTFNSLPAGLHTFTILDAAFNTALLDVALAEPGTFTASVGSKTDVSINGASTGEVILTASGGTPPYRYSKNGTAFQTSETFSTLPAGSYTFTVRDAVSATTVIETTISQPPVLTFSLASQKNLTSYNSNTGEANFAGAGGIEPYKYSKDGTSFQSSPTFTGLAAGVYTFTIKDAGSATATIPVTITQPVFDVTSIKAMNNFTPNGDGVNDKWEIENVTLFPEHTLTIFDRGGRVLLKEKNYKNDWEGTVNGSALREGTYYYSITFDIPEIGMKKGFITIIR